MTLRDRLFWESMKSDSQYVGSTISQVGLSIRGRTCRQTIRAHGELVSIAAVSGEGVEQWRAMRNTQGRLIGYKRIS